MTVINYFECKDKQHWLDEIRACEWRAGQYLYELLSSGKFFEMTGESSQLLLLTDSERLVSLCTLAERDDIPDSGLSPWIGFVYTYPEFRGRHCAGQLLREAEARAKLMGFNRVFISTTHIGLYEKYGYGFLTQMKDICGEMSRVYVKDI